ncbi:hypothetical protein LZZ90_08400 [Flavobacterium sp. SM15]|uniref:hypothetical protein n=1 Tax=Flavobacterium sp. SM15 TaxID=2908005 RepID=UPI001EDC43BA|nr:hypothetical protein [Flavobacterium sp. SM15]MCG2611527.1 hypothetical protein [Flavobacterium sp. SM15]
MTEYEIKRAMVEYDVAITSIRQTRLFGYESQLAEFNYWCAKTDRHKETDKNGVRFQTDFINETYKDFLVEQRTESYSLNKLKSWYDELLTKSKDTIDWDMIIAATEPNNLHDIIKTHYHNMPDEVYWEIVGHCYTMSNLAHTDMEIILSYINDSRPKKEYMMDEDEREFFNNLPDEVTIYRGCSKKEIESGNYRISWTLDKKVAEFFAYEYINLNFEKSFEKDKSKFDVVEKTVNKSELLAYFGGRNESEVLYLPSLNK